MPKNKYIGFSKREKTETYHFPSTYRFGGIGRGCLISVMTYGTAPSSKTIYYWQLSDFVNARIFICEPSMESCMCVRCICECGMRESFKLCMSLADAVPDSVSPAPASPSYTVLPSKRLPPKMRTAAKMLRFIRYTSSICYIFHNHMFYYTCLSELIPPTKV